MQGHRSWNHEDSFGSFDALSIARHCGPLFGGFPVGRFPLVVGL